MSSIKTLLKMVSNVFYGEICLTKLKVYPFFVEICMGETLRMSSLKNLSTQSAFKYKTKVQSDFSMVNFVQNWIKC
jgi:hypothetical protein